MRDLRTQRAEQVGTLGVILLGCSCHSNTLGLCTTTTARPSSGPVVCSDGPPSFDREVSLEIARQRKLDAEMGVVTEKYSGLRIK